LSVQAEVTRAAEQFDDVVDDAFGGHVEVPVEVGGEFGLGASSTAWVVSSRTCSKSAMSSSSLSVVGACGLPSLA
jgi:hypothetical protein